MIKPSRDAVKRIRKRLADEMRSLRGSNAMAVIARLNPIIRGWAAYYRGVVSSNLFSALDQYVWWLTYRWARHSHPNKPKKWIARRYFGRFNKFRNDRWVFGARDRPVNDRGDVAYLVKFSWTPIVRHQMVAGGASPDDPDLIDYWAARRRKVKPPLDGYNLRLLTEQDGRCPLCGDHLLTPDQPPQSPARVGTMVAEHRQERHRRRLPHPPRARRHVGREPNALGARLLPSQPPGPRTQEPEIIDSRDVLGACLSRMPGKRARPVLRGPRRSNAPGLPDMRLGEVA